MKTNKKKYIPYIVLGIVAIVILGITVMVNSPTSSNQSKLTEKQGSSNYTSPSATPTSQPQTCVVTNCHGYDITCGPKPTEDIICQMYLGPGDACRTYAKCGFVDGKCQLIKDSQYNACKACEQKCAQDITCEENCVM